jgi:valyl-tRNA synthetase
VARCDEATAAQLAPLSPYFLTMAAATLRDLGPSVTPPKPSATFSASGVEVFVDLAGHIDIAAETAKNEKERTNLLSLIAGKEKKLSNESFVSRAPADVVEKERASLAELRERLAAVEVFLGELGGKQ